MEQQHDPLEVFVVWTSLTLLGLLLLSMAYGKIREWQLSRSPKSTPAPYKEKAQSYQATPQSTQAEAPQVALLRLRQWLNLVNNRPDDVPHLFIQGGSGTGKTTFTKAILNDRSDQIAVVGIKPDDEWGSRYIYRSDERETALEQLLKEVNYRLDHNDKSGLTIVLDDFTRLASSHTAAVELYKLVADIGRSLRIRLILIARGRLVKAIGAKGESDLHEHFVFISLHRDHSAVLEYDEEEYLLDTQAIPQLSRPISIERWWKPQPPKTAQTPLQLSKVYSDDLDVPVRPAAAHIFSNPVHTSTGGTGGTPHQEAVPPEGAEENLFEGVPAIFDAEIIRTLYTSGMSKNQIAARMRGTKSKRLAIINEALEQEPVP